MKGVKLTKRETTIIFVLIAVGITIVLIAAGLTGYIIYPSKNPTVYVYNYHGYDFVFRANLTEALSVPVYPNDTAVFKAVMNPNVSLIYVAFVNSTNNGLVAVNGFEVSNKLATIFYMNGLEKKIKGKPVESYNLTGTEGTLTIAMIPPVLANKTEVRLEDNVIFISGTNSKEFDLATVRFLMSVMEVVA